MEKRPLGEFTGAGQPAAAGAEILQDPLDKVRIAVGRDLKGVVTHPLSAVAALVYVVGSVSLLAFFPRQAAVSPETAAGQVAAAPTEVIAEDQLAEFDKWIEAQPRVQLPVSADGARVVVVKFNDYQCPSCRQTYVEYKGILEKLKADGRVKFVTMDFPLDSQFWKIPQHQN